MLAVIIISAGCSTYKDPWAEKRPKVFPASGQVLYKEKPLEEAMVVFHSEDKSATVFARTDSQGRFRLATQAYGNADGAPAGQYQVTIEKRKITGGSDKVGPDEIPGAKVQEVFLTPKQYSQPDKTPLKAEVVPDKDNVFEFRLTD
ncbi:carboxypeptidase-like regulatory domain-containing protein [Planctomicrobium sp. SH661]|uniref:carboxypeptidase-like regulatory domain-containing protein n=1 Tax=Planctomicrobium sp. SH661 TaxID=3448124 RepID=UPI003F5B7A7B